MKKILFSAIAAVVLMSTFTSCSNDDDNDNTAKFEEQSFSTWSKAVFAYGTMFDDGETLTVNENSVTFHSDTWGDGTFNVNALTPNADGTYKVTATGTITMAGHGEPKAYDATLSGDITKSAQTFTITIPAVMGGTTLNVTAGEIPLAAAIDGTYKGGTYANSKYFQHYQPIEGEKASIKANDDLTSSSLSYTSATWGTFTFDNVNVTKNEDGSYLLTAEGNTLMPGMGGGDPKEYAATLESTLSNGTLVATFAVPSVMGGTTVYFNADDFEEVLAAAQTEEETKK